MQDIFIEYMVRRRSTAKIKLLKLGIVLLAIVVGGALFVASSLIEAISFLSVAFLAGAGFGAYHLITSMNVEFEYSLTNGELDVDKIVAERKRRRLVTVRCRDVMDFGRYNEDDHKSKTYQNKIFACDNPKNDDVWFFTFPDKLKGETLLVFNASERMLSGMKPFLPRILFRKAFGAEPTPLP